MKTNELRNKSSGELRTELLSLLREQFNLRMKTASRQSKQTHLLKQVRRNIALVKSLLTERANIRNE